MKQESILQDEGWFSDSYENSLRPPASFSNLEHPQKSQDKQPDKIVIQSDQSICSVSSEFISIKSTINNSHPLPPNSDNFTVNDGSCYLLMVTAEKVSYLSSDPEDSDLQESEVSTGLTMRVSSKRLIVRVVSSKRIKDDKNGPKKMITILNQSLSLQQMKKLKKELKRLCRLQRLDPKKGSRYGFTCFLINIKQILGQDILEEIFETFSEKMKDFDKSCDLSEEKGKYLKSLIPRYLNSFRDFIHGDVQSSVEWTYSFDEFKQEAYKAQGHAYVLNYGNLVRQLITQTPK